MYSNSFHNIDQPMRLLSGNLSKLIDNSKMLNGIKNLNQNDVNFQKDQQSISNYK